MKTTGVMIAMLRSQEVDFQTEVLVFNQSKHYNICVENDLVKQSTVHKPLYEELLSKHGQNDSVAINIQLIKGVLPDLFAVLKFLDSDDDLA